MKGDWNGLDKCIHPKLCPSEASSSTISLKSKPGKVSVHCSYFWKSFASWARASLCTAPVASAENLQFKIEQFVLPCEPTMLRSFTSSEMNHVRVKTNKKWTCAIDNSCCTRVQKMAKTTHMRHLTFTKKNSKMKPAENLRSLPLLLQVGALKKQAL